MPEKLFGMSRRSLQRIASFAIGVSALWLVAFHIALFWRRIADATIQHPAVLARWIASALLIAAGLAAHRYLSRHWSRRRTLVFALLVLALHVGLPAEERIVGVGDLMSLAVDATLLAIVTGLVATPIAIVSANSISSAPAIRRALPSEILLAASASPRAPPAR